MRKALRVIAVSASTLALASASFAVTLPDTGSTTLLTANVSEQASVSVPAGVTFNVIDVAASTVASNASVSVTNIVLATATKQLKVSLQAAAASFTPPVALATTWSASDVSWNASSWTSGTGASGTLTNASYTQVATCDADAASCSSSAIVFTLAAKSAVKRSGNHTLSVTWKFEAIGA